MRSTKRAGFTMMEIMIAAVVLVILASVALVGYQGYRDRAAMLVDETNQQVLAAAIKMYAYDNNALPGSLSELRPELLERAFAQVTEGKQPFTLLAHLREWVRMGVAEAAPLPARYYNNNPTVLICPRKVPASASYQLDPFWPNKPLSALLDSANGGRLLIVEDAYRHAGDTTRVVTYTSGVHKREKDSSHGGGKSSGDSGQSSGGGDKKGKGGGERSEGDDSTLVHPTLSEPSTKAR